MKRHQKRGDCDPTVEVRKPTAASHQPKRISLHFSCKIEMLKHFAEFFKLLVLTELTGNKEYKSLRCDVVEAQLFDFLLRFFFLVDLHVTLILQLNQQLHKIVALHVVLFAVLDSLSHHGKHEIFNIWLDDLKLENFEEFWSEKCQKVSHVSPPVGFKILRSHDPENVLRIIDAVVLDAEGNR